MHTRSQTRNLHNQQHQAPPAVVEPFNLEDPLENHPPPPPPPMDEQLHGTIARKQLRIPSRGYVSQAAAANFNQGNTGYRGQISNQIRPPGFPPVQNHQNQGNNQNRYNQNRGNFNQAPAYQPPVHQGQVYRPQVVQPPAYQAPAYHPTSSQIQGVSNGRNSKSYVKANDAVMRNMQTQGQNMQNQLTTLTDMLSKFVASNTASTSGTLPSNTVTNPKEDLKGITTRSGVAYKGPTIPITSSSPKVMERDTEVTKDTMHPTNNGSTEDVPPPVVPIVNHESISEPANTPVSASRPNQKASIPFSFREKCERTSIRSFSILSQTPRVPLILGEEFLKDKSHALIDWQSPLTISNRIYCLPPTLTPFGDSDFLLFEEADSFLALEDDPTSPEVDPTYYDPKGHNFSSNQILNSEPLPTASRKFTFP
ncbi:hypothetical protein Tco_0316922 [Tanacetum coccineum]